MLKVDENGHFVLIHTKPTLRFEGIYYLAFELFPSFLVYDFLLFESRKLI